MLPGVVDSWVGYTGGATPDPTYETVCANDGHTEALRLAFDPKQTSYEEVLTQFFEDPRVRDVYPGAEGKAQYRTAVWAQDEKQAEIATRVSHAVGKQVPVLPLDTRHDAEEWHQHFILGFKDFPDDDDEEEEK